MNCLGELLDNAGIGCRLGNNYCNNFWYADDLCLVAPSRRALQRLIDICLTYVQNHNIAFNCKKTVYMKFSAKGKASLMTPDILLDNYVLDWINEFNYLGYTISNNKNCDDLEVKKRTKNMRVQAIILGIRFAKASCEVKRKLFSTFFSTIYCEALWLPSNRCLRKVTVAHNYCFRAVFNKYGRYSLYAEMVRKNVLTFGAFRRKAILSLYNRLHSIDNDIIKSVLCFDSFFRAESHGYAL